MTPPDTNSTPSGRRPRTASGLRPRVHLPPLAEPLGVVGSDGDTLYLTAPEGIRAWAERRYSA